MARPVHDRPLGLDELYALPDDDRRYELQAGVLLSEPPTGFRHGLVVSNVNGILRDHARRDRLGVVIAGDSGFVLARDPVTVRAPDVAFVSRERMARQNHPERAFEGAPDLAVEVLSPSNRPEAMHAKVADYLAAGTRLVWILDPARGTVTVHRSLLAPQVLRGGDELEGGDVLPGLRVRVEQLFED